MTDFIPTNCMIGGRKDRLALRRRFCARNRLFLEPVNERPRFGYMHYKVRIPAELPKERALRIARAMKARRKLLKLTHVANALCKYAGRPTGPKAKRIW